MLTAGIMRTYYIHSNGKIQIRMEPFTRIHANLYCGYLTLAGVAEINSPLLQILLQIQYQLIPLCEA